MKPGVIVAALAGALPILPPSTPDTPKPQPFD